MSNKFLKIVILLGFVSVFVGSAIWMYKNYVVPNSPYHTELKLRGSK